MYCSNCGASNPGDASFCNACGAAIDATAENVTNPEASVPAKPIGGFTHPNWQILKGYILYVILAGYLLTLFSTSTLRFSWRYDEDAESGYSRFSGIGLLTGDLPKIYSNQEGRVMNSEITSNMSGPEKGLARTPLLFRTGYIFLTLGLLFYLLTVFVYNQPHQRYLNGIARIFCLFSAFAVFWVFGDFEKWLSRISGSSLYSSFGERPRLNVETHFSIGFWLVFAGFILLAGDYLSGVIKAAGKTGNNPIRYNIQNV